MKQKVRQLGLGLLLGGVTTIAHRYGDPGITYGIALVLGGYVGSDVADVIWGRR